MEEKLKWRGRKKNNVLQTFFVNFFRLLQRLFFTKVQRGRKTVNLWVKKKLIMQCGFYNICRHKTYNNNDTKDQSGEWK